MGENGGGERRRGKKAGRPDRLLRKMSGVKPTGNARELSGFRRLGGSFHARARAHRVAVAVDVVHAGQSGTCRGGTLG